MTSREASYCPDCGAELAVVEIGGRPRRECPDCGEVVWRNAVPAVDVTVLDGDRVLLVSRGGTGRWSVPGGTPEYDEDPRTAAVRELRAATGLRADPAALELLAASNVAVTGRDTHLFAVGFRTTATATEGALRDGDDDDRRASFVPVRQVLDGALDVPRFAVERVRAATR